MGIYCAPLVADLFLFRYERDFMTSLSDVKQAEIIEAFKSTSRYLDDLLNIGNPYFEGMVNPIYSPELQLNKANTSETAVPFLDLPTRPVLMANPTPASWNSSLLRSLQKNVLPAPTDLSYFCKASLNQSCYLLYLPSSLQTKAAPGCGLFDPALSISVPTSREPIVKGTTFVFFLCVCIHLATNRDLADHGY